jgi:hypothetical protein
MSERMTPGKVVGTHRLGFLPELRLGAEIVEGRFSAGCSMTNCNSDCCSGGVYADVAEMEQILLHADLVRAHMDPGQVKDTSLWFEKETVEDMDYPSGRAVGTEVHGDRCVFLNSQGHCVLQKAAAASGMDRYALKPFFCWLYPVTLDSGVLALDDPEFVDRPACCKHGKTGELTIFDVCPEELKLVLGEEGFNELRDGIHPSEVKRDLA